jgi:hypothetical protein
MENNNVTEPNNNNEDEVINMNSPEFKIFEQQFIKWLYSDPEYTYRLNNEGSGNW